MDKQLITELANAIEVEPEQIMDYRQVDDGTYNVILFSFQKYTGVEPLEIPAVPEEYRKTYNNPGTAKKEDLILVADYLDLEVEGDFKRHYVKAITAHRNS